MKKSRFLAVVILAVGLIINSACEKTPDQVSIIDSLTANTNVVESGQIIYIDCQLLDVEGSLRKFSWICSGGVFPNYQESNTTTWLAPTKSGEYMINVNVFNGEYTSKDSIYIQVTEGYDGTFVDVRDGTTYGFVNIGTQSWMAENLAYLPELQKVTEKSRFEPQYYLYGDFWNDFETAKNTTGYKTYGVLYNWPAAMTGCPDGWHLPSDEEWQTLESFLGMNEADLNLYLDRNSGNIGEKLKSNWDWIEDGNGDNSSGLNFRPAGFRVNSNEHYFYRKKATYIWTSTPYEDSGATCRYIKSDVIGVDRYAAPVEQGYTVRCLRDQ